MDGWHLLPRMRIALVLTVVALVGQALLPARALAREPDWQPGFLLWDQQLRLDDPAVERSLDRLRASGARQVSPVVDWFVADAQASDIAPGPTTPSDQQLRHFVELAHARQLQVVLTLHVNCLDGTWRGFLRPRDVDRWFSQYQALLQHYATLAEELGVEGLVIGAELIQLSGPAYTERWEGMIAAVRARYRGFLTYSANWGSAAPGADPLEEFSRIEFWPLLDYLGIAAYFNLSDGGHTSRQALLSAWQRWYERKIAPFHQRYQKPLLFTEVGYRSAQGAASRPWDPAPGDLPNPQTQMELYHALFEFWQNVDWLQGVYLWYWTPWPWRAPIDDYPVQDKLAAEVVGGWFRRLAQPTPECPIERAYQGRCTGLLP